jgi:hypothetical protein
MKDLQLVKVISNLIGNHFYSLQAYEVAQLALGMHTAELVNIKDVPPRALFNEILTFRLPDEDVSLMWCTVPVKEFQKAHASATMIFEKRAARQEANSPLPFQGVPKLQIAYSRKRAQRDYTANIEFYKKHGKLPEAVEVKKNDKAG